jgi:microcompartment protein CcmL/EutN
MAPTAEAIGMIEVEGVAGIVVASDAACKSTAVELMGWESTGGFTTAFFGGSVSEVDVSLRTGEEAARQVVDHVVAAPLTRPEPAWRAFVSVPAPPGDSANISALGLLETRGYGSHVATNDLMVKSADVEVYNVLTVHNRVVCTLVRGPVAAVRVALAEGRERMTQSEWFLCSTLITRPVPAVLAAFGPRMES